MKNGLLMLLLVLGIAAAPALADEASHLRAALELIEVTNTQAIMEQMLAAVETSLAQNLMSLDMSPEGQEAARAVQAEMMDWFEGVFNWERMRNLYADIYMDVFSESEILELTEFYRSPLGMKLLEKTPELLEKTMARTRAELQQLLPELQQRLMDSLSGLSREDAQED